MLAAPDFEIVEEVDSPLSRIGWLVAGELQHERDVVGGIQKWKQVVELEDEPDLLQPQPAKIVAEPFAIEDDLAIQAHASARRIEDAGDDVEQRRLARAGGPAQGHDLPGRDVDRDVAQGIDAGLALAKVLGDASQAHECVFWTRASPCSAPERGGRVGLEGGPHAESACQQADKDDHASERQHIVQVEHDAARKVVLDGGDEQGAQQEPRHP